jgi:preprotein translocase subunit SecG
MTETLLIFQVILAVAITIVVLLQKSSSIGLGAYSGSNDSVFGAKGPMNFLTKATFTMGFLFVVNTIALGYYYNKDYSSSIVDTVNVESVVPTVPTAPKADTSAPAAPVK